MLSPKHTLPRLLLLLLLLAGKAALAQQPDPLEASMAGEFALQAGRLQQAAGFYLQAAQAAQDPALAERATRIALLAGADPLASQAHALWQRLAPQQAAEQGMVAATLALRGGHKWAARRALRAVLAKDEGWRQALMALTGAVGQRPKLVAAMVADVIKRGALPDQLQAWLAFGGLAQRLGKTELVDAIVRQVVQRFPDEPRAALLQAQLLREAGKHAQARLQLQRLAAMPKLPVQLRWALAGEYQALGDFAAAAHVLAQGPQDDASLARRAALLDAADDQAGLAALYAELKRDASLPNSMRRLLLGQLAEQLGQHAEALAWFSNVPDPQLQGVASLRSAMVLHAMGRDQAAFAALQALQTDASQEDTVRRDAYLMEAELQQAAADVVGEESAFARGLAAFPDDQALLYSRALMWERRDRIDKAEADFRRILLLAPEDVATLNALGYTLADRTTRFREALELIDRARVADPGNAAIIDSYGWVLFRLGKLREALMHLRHAYALQKDPDIASHLGQVLWVLGERDEARKYFDEARKLDPHSRALQRALQEVGA